MAHLSIVTASHNNPDGLKALHASMGTLPPDVEWIVKDSGRNAPTAAWLAGLPAGSVTFSTAPDTGIYDALNQALALASGEFYLVVGSDDTLDANAIADIAGRMATGRFEQVDVACFPVAAGGRTLRPNRMVPLWVSVSGLVSSHSVGTVIRRALHERHGLYDTRYRIVADALFLKRAALGKARFETFNGPVTGRFSTDGVSSIDLRRRVLEAYSYNVETGSPVALQALLLAGRIIKLGVGSFV